MSKNVSRKPKVKDDFSDIDNLERATENFLQDQFKLLAARRPVRAPRQRGMQKMNTRSGKTATAADAGREARRRMKVQRQVIRDKMTLEKVAARQEEIASRKSTKLRISGAWIGAAAGLTLAAVLAVTSIAVFAGRRSSTDELIRPADPQTTIAVAEQTGTPAQTEVTTAETAAASEEVSATAAKTSALPKQKQTTASAASSGKAVTTAALNDAKDLRAGGGTNSAAPAQPAAQHYVPADYEDDVQDAAEENEYSTQMNSTRPTSSAQKITTTKSTSRSSAAATRHTSASTKHTTASATRKSTTTTTTTTTTSRPTTAPTTRKSTTTTTTTTTTTAPPPPPPAIDVAAFEVLDWELVDEEQDIYTQRVRLHLYNDSPTALNNMLMIPLVCENAKEVRHIRCLSGNVETSKGVSFRDDIVFLPFTAYMKGWTYQYVELEITTQDYIKDFWIDYDAE